MQAEAVLLDWYLAMGVDEVMEDSPQDRFSIVAQQEAAKVTKPPQAAQIMAQASRPPLPQTAPLAPDFQQAVAEAERLAKEASDLASLEQAVKSFKGLSICKTATNPVFADGVAGAPLMILGEAPGAQEDRQGIPFCGPSGQLLDKMLAAIDRDRASNAYISNVIFWRPPGNRNPTEEERAVCLPFVQKHLALAKPELLLLTGAIAVNALLKESKSISRLRGNLLSYTNPLDGKEIPVIISYHPSYLLRQPKQKKLAWQDMLAVKTQLEN
jgi:DNA polymerase